jgi:hypothetical protein
MWSSRIGKECNSSQVYCEANRWIQKSQEFSNDLEKGFLSGKMEGEKIDLYEKVLKKFSPLKILNTPFSKEREIWSFSSFLFFVYASLSLSFLCSISLLMMNSGFLKHLRRKQICFQTFFQMGWKWQHQDL